MPEIICEGCGQVAVVAANRKLHGGRGFCTVACGNRTVQKVPPRKTCPECGRIFHSRDRMQVYCTPKCRDRRAIRRKMESRRGRTTADVSVRATDWTPNYRPVSQWNHGLVLVEACPRCGGALVGHGDDAGYTCMMCGRTYWPPAGR